MGFDQNRKADPGIPNFYFHNVGELSFFKKFHQNWFDSSDKFNTKVYFIVFCSKFSSLAVHVKIR
jgi:hypothetical protein